MKKLLLILVCISFSTFFYAQADLNELISPSSLINLNLDINQLEKYNNIKKDPLYESIIPITLGDLPALQKDGLITFSLPNRITSSLTAKVHRVEAFENGDFDWYGNLINELGIFHLIKNEGNLFGRIQVKDDIYLIEDFGKSQNVLYQLNKKELAKRECGNHQEDEHLNNPKREVSAQSRSTCTDTEIRVLVLYTDKAVMEVPNIQTRAQQAISEANNGLNNSAISFSDARFQLTSVRPLSSFMETPFNSTADVNKLSTDPTADNLRQNDEADIVILFTGDSYGNLQGRALSTVDVGEEFAFAIVVAEDAIGDFAFAHEIAHLLGCGHQGSGTSARATFAHGHVFNANGNKETIMGADGSNTRVLYYSNPNINYSGTNVSTGIANVNDNVRQIEDDASVVGCYLPYNPNMTVSISGTTTGNNATTGSWSAGVANCSTVTNYKWEMSTDGFSYSTVANGSSASTLTMSFPQNMDFTLRLTGTCIDNQVETAFVTVYNSDAQNCSPCAKIVPLSNLGKLTITKDPQYTQDQVNIFPNPAKGQVNLVVELTKESYVTASLIDVHGKEIVNYPSIFLKKGKHTIEENMDRYVSGIYFYQVNIDGHILTKRIILED